MKIDSEDENNLQFCKLLHFWKGKQKVQPLVAEMAKQKKTVSTKKPVSNK